MRRMIQVPLIVLTLIALTNHGFSGLFAQEDAQQELSEMELIEHVANLQRQLEAVEIPKRDSAEKELIQLGVRVLDYLEQTTDKTPSDAVLRTSRIRQALEKIAVASVTQASTITLEGKTTVGQALESIRKQTQNDVALPDGTPDVFRDREIDLDFENAKFWEVLTKLMDQGDLIVDPYGGLPGQLRLTPTQAARIEAANPGQGPENAGEKKAAAPPRNVSGVFDLSLIHI